MNSNKLKVENPKKEAVVKILSEALVKAKQKRLSEKLFDVILDDSANLADSNFKKEFFPIQTIECDLTEAEAKRKVFELAKREADFIEGDSEYSWETNATNIYFNSKDKKTLVGKLWDESIQIQDRKYSIKQIN